MRRCSAIGGVLLVLALATPAWAQYDPESTTTTRRTTTTTEATTTTTTAAGTSPSVTGAGEATTTTLRPSTTTTEAPPPAVQPSSVDNATPAPGQDTTLSSPAVAGAPTLDSTKPVAGVLVSASLTGTNVPIVPQLTVEPNGTVRVRVSIPPSTPEGIYMMAIVGTDPSGKSRVLICPIVVKRSSNFVATSKSSVVPRPAAVADEQIEQVKAIVSASDITPAREAEMMNQVTSGKAHLELDGELLVLRRPAEDGVTRPLLAALAVGVVTGSLVVIRRPKLARRRAR